MSAVGAVVRPDALIGEVAPVKQPDVTLDATGHRIAVAWRGVPGATGARVEAATVTVRPATSGSGRDVGIGAPGRSRVTAIDVSSPERGAPVRGVAVPGLKRHVDDVEVPIRDTAALDGLRLVVRPVVGGRTQAPVVAVPALAARNALPAQLTGGSFGGGVLGLPDLVADRFTITLCEGGAPEDFVAQEISHDDVRVLVAPGPRDLTVVGPDGADVFTLAGPLTGRLVVDVRAALERYLSSVAGDDAPAGTITVRAGGRGAAGVDLTVTGAVLERRVAGRTAVESEGAPVELALDVPSARVPARTLADLTVTHHGLALHPLSDPPPGRVADLAGPVVRDVAVERRLPPEALRGERLRRVCVVGRVLAVADLQVTVLGRVATVEARAVTTTPGAEPVWFDLGEDVEADRPVVVSLTATRGLFAWVADPEPLVRLAVVGGPDRTSVTVAGRPVPLTGPETVVAGLALAGAAPWPVETDQFCTVALSRVVQEFSP